MWSDKNTNLNKWTNILLANGVNYQLPLYDQQKFTWRQSFGRTLIFKTCLERK